MPSSVSKDGGPYNARMNQYILLFRGINVGSNRRLPMKELTALLEDDGCADVRTYIQSGNVIVRCAVAKAAGLAQRVTAAISKSHGFEPEVFVLTRGELEKAAAANPFPQADERPQSLHLFFLKEAPKKPNLKPLDAIKAKTESFALKGNVFYLYTPDGFGKSKLGGSAEKLLGVDATARNWRTVKTLLDLSKTP
jgi:uncharacterized protein (DUF1697 family)